MLGFSYRKLDPQEPQDLLDNKELVVSAEVVPVEASEVEIEVASEEPPEEDSVVETEVASEVETEVAVSYIYL
jgi:hypothetical protein